MTTQTEFLFPESSAVLGYLCAMDDGRRAVVRPHDEPGQWVCQFEAPDGTVFSTHGPTTEDAALAAGRRVVTSEDAVCWQRVWLYPAMPWKPRVARRRPGHACFYD